MLLRPILATLLALPLAATHAHADDPSSWSSILENFFMGPQVKEEFHWSGRLPAEKTLEIKGINGRIVAEPAPGSDIVIDATKTGRRQKPSDVKIEVVEHAQGLTVCAVYPTPFGSSPNECAPGPKGGRMSVRNNDVSVAFRVKVPAGVRLVARTVNGGVDASGLTADVSAYTVNGSVALRTKGHAQAETVNGSIRAGLGQAQWSGQPLHFETVNGSITVELPATTSTAIDAQTVNGRIHSDFTLAQTTKVSRNKLAGVIGNGGRSLELETVNGSITLSRQ
jgi:hypothetical protein